METINLKPKYRIVTPEGKIVDTFRLKTTANQMLHKLSLAYLQKLKIEEIEDGELSTPS